MVNVRGSLHEVEEGDARDLFPGADEPGGKKRVLFRDKTRDSGVCARAWACKEAIKASMRAQRTVRDGSCGYDMKSKQVGIRASRCGNRKAGWRMDNPMA